MRLFQRACTRAGVQLRYSQGFNPRPKLSLPLPRTVAVESEDDLLCIYVDSSSEDIDTEKLEREITNQLPPGCEIVSVEIVKEKISFIPSAVTYVLPLKPEFLDEKLKNRVDELMAEESINVTRTIAAKAKVRNIDVRGYLRSVDFDREDVIVNCNITPSGTIRVDEIFSLLGLDQDKLTAPIRRRNIEW